MKEKTDKDVLTGFWERHFGENSFFVKYYNFLQILILIVGMIVAIVAAFIGASVGANEQARLAFNNEQKSNKVHEENAAKMLYLDIINLEYTLWSNMAHINAHTKNDNLILVGIIYPDNGLYYSYRTEITSLNTSVAENITIFYDNVIYADFYRNQLKSLKTGTDTYNLSFDQYEWAINEAACRQYSLEKELENTYNISIVNQSNRFRINSSQIPICVPGQ